MFEILEAETLVLVYASFFESLLSLEIIRCREYRLPSVRIRFLILTSCCYRFHIARIIRII
jgi:hypothetical protein